jgi:hypothetical protein
LNARQILAAQNLILLSAAAAPSADLLSRSQKLGAQLNITHSDARCLCVHDNIELIWDFPARSSEYLPEKALDAIANHGSTDFPGDRDTQPSVAKNVFTAEQNKTLRVCLPPRFVQLSVFRRLDNPESPGKTLGFFFSHSPSAFCVL